MKDDKNRWFGLHKRLSSAALRKELERLGLVELAKWREKLDQEELAAAVYAHLGRVFSAAFLELRERDRATWEAYISDLKEPLSQAGHPLASLLDELPELQFRELTEIVRPEDQTVKARATIRPGLPLALSGLLLIPK